MWNKIRQGLIDRLLAPYNEAAFERFARRYVRGPRSSRIQIAVGLLAASIMFLGACALASTAAKLLYLDAYGLEAPGKILDVSFHADTRHIRWKKLDYEFKTPSGELVRGRTDRPVHELANVPEDDRFTVKYWDRFPGINTPRGLQSDVGFIVGLAAFLLLACVHFVCLTRRLVHWGRGLLVASSASP